MKPLISIIVPIYKVEKFLKRCIESIIHQTYRNLEIILVDDGSPDSCGAICDEYKEIDDRIVVIHKKNGGLSDARNVGISVANGEYIGFVDSDDYIEPEMYEMLLKAAISSNLPLAMCGFYCEKDTGEIDPLSYISLIPDKVLSAEETFEKLSQGNGWFFAVAWNKLYHKSLLNEKFYPRGKYHEDEFVIAPLLWDAKKVACISGQYYHYIYLREGSITGSKTDLKHLDAVEALCKRCYFYHSIGKDEYMTEDRAYSFTLLEKYTLNPLNNTTEIKKRLKEVLKLYSAIPVMRKSEKIKLWIFKVNPHFEYNFIRKLRRFRKS